MTYSGSTTILSGSNPLTDPTALFLLQLLIIIVLCRIIAIPLGYMRQPRVIAEVIAGIILGQSALSKVHWFGVELFTPISVVRLKVIAELGLVLFLFLIGMEIDPKKMFSNIKQSAAISIAGIVLPFVISIGASRALYDQLMVPDVEASLATSAPLYLPPFASFLIFIGVAMSITAFPVLARILAEKKLLQTMVGQITLSSAALDDAVAWCLLILVVAIINNTGQYATAVYVFLITVGYGLFLVFAVRPIFSRIVSLRSDSDNISQLSVFLVFVIVLLSAFFTNAIGVHSMFGGFLAGLIIPHEHGFAIKLTEKIEDIVTILFLPLYFTNSGLNTRIDLLNDGTTWAMVALVFFCACGGKLIGCTLAAKGSGLKWRESLTVGFLMNTKGLVEIIVLNLGLSAGVISPRIFTVMVVMALLTTFMTVPIVSAIYPMRLYLNPDGTLNEKKHLASSNRLSLIGNEESELKLMVCVKTLQCVPSLMALLQMIQSAPIDMTVYALRLISLSERNSTVMQAAEEDITIKGDSALNIFKTFGEMNRIGFKPLLAVSHADDFADNILSQAQENNTQVIIVPWLQHTERNSFGINQYFDDNQRHHLCDKLNSHATCTVVVFIDRGLTIKAPQYDNQLTTRSKRSDMMTSLIESPQIVYVPFIGGKNARESLLFGMYFTHFPGVTVKIIRLKEQVGVIEMGESTKTLDEMDGDGTEDEKLLLACKQMSNVAMEEIVSKNGDEGITTFLSKASVQKCDMVIIGRSLYGRAGVKQYIDNECAASVCIVQRNDVKENV